MTTSLTLDGLRAVLPDRPESGHKGIFGHLFVLAGSRGFTGAAKLVCEAACRSGVGLVTLGIPYPLGDIIASALTEAMSLRLPSTDIESLAHEGLDQVLAFAADKQAVVLGPGLSRHPDTIAFVQDFLPHCPTPLLVDADGLNALSEHPELLHEVQRPCLLTPHPGEMARLLGGSTAAVQADREGVAKAFAMQYGCGVVLKGHATVIAAPDGRTAINPTGNSGLATGGTGDVLAGLVGGLLAQGMQAFDAACLGVYLHGLAADIVAERTSPRGMIARDVILALPEAWRRIEG